MKFVIVSSILCCALFTSCVGVPKTSHQAAIGKYTVRNGSDNETLELLSDSTYVHKFSRPYENERIQVGKWICKGRDCSSLRFYDWVMFSTNIGQGDHKVDIYDMTFKPVVYKFRWTYVIRRSEDIRMDFLKDNP